MDKYRIKLIDERIIGPFSESEIIDLFEKRYIDGSEHYQLFPAGEWNLIKEFGSLLSIFNNFKKSIKRVQLDSLEENEPFEQGTRVLSELLKFKNDELESHPISKEEILTNNHRKVDNVQLEEFNYKNPEKNRPIKTLDNDSLLNTDNKSDDYNNSKDKNFLDTTLNKDFGDIENSSKGKKTDQEFQSKNGDSKNNESFVIDEQKDKTDENLIDKTVIRSIKGGDLNTLHKNGAKPNNLDQTIVNPLAAIEVEKLRVQELQKKIEDEEEADNKRKLNSQLLNSEEDKRKESITDELTQIANINELFSNSMIKGYEIDLIKDLKKNEDEDLSLQSEFSIIEAKSQNAIIEQNDLDEKIKKGESDQKNLKIKKGTTPIVAIAIVVVLYFYFFDEEKVQNMINPKNPNFIYPQEIEKIDERKSSEAYELGLIHYQKNFYNEKIKAADYFVQSMQYKRNNKALSALILVYADLLPHIVQLKINLQDDKESKKIAEEATARNSLINKNLKEKAGSIIYSLITEGQLKSLSDINMAIGVANFYSYYKKYGAAIKVLNNFLRFQTTLDPKKRDLNNRFFVTYLGIALKAERKELVQELVPKLEAIPEKSIDTYLVLCEYYISNNNFEKASEIITEGTKKIKNSVALYLEYVKVLFILEQYDKIKPNLDFVKKLGGESSGLYYSKYLEYSGMLLANQKKNKEALELFQIALALSDSMELRTKIATIETSKDLKNNNGLILESKIIDLINKSKEAKKEYDWNSAFNYAMDAADLSETNITSKLYLSQLQTERGFYSEAITMLNDLHSLYPIVKEIDIALINTYINAYKFEEAKNLIGNLAQTDFRETIRYNSLLGYFYYKSGKHLEAVKWFLESTKKDPLNDKDFSYLAEIYFYFKKFKDAKTILSKIIDLDPSNINYQIMYSKILYEMESADMAIGYLEAILDNEKKGGEILLEEEKARLISEIAIYYHKSGKIGEFNKMKEKIEQFKKKDKVLYEFLIEVAKLEDKTNDFVNYSTKLLEIDPGNINARMALGERLIEENRLDEALSNFVEVTKRLESFPKVNFFISKIYFLKNNLVEAKKYANLEIKSNPDLEFGYLLMAEISIKEENYNESTNFYKKAQSINQNSADAIMGLAWISFNRNNIDTALDLYGKAAKFEPNNPIIRRQLGYVYKAMGQGMLAIESFKTYLELSPDAKDKDEILKIMKMLE